jgi:hypothetical protein
VLRGAILNNLRSRPSGIPPGGRFALERTPMDRFKGGKKGGKGKGKGC